MATIDANSWVQSLGDVKDELQIASTDTSKDTWLTNLINRSYLVLEQYCGRKMFARDYTEYYDGDGTDILLVDQYPINSIAALYDDINRLWTSSSLKQSTEYVFYSNGMNEPFKIRLISYTTGSGSISAVFLRGIQNLKIQYNAGFTTIPADLVQAQLSYIDWLYNRAGMIGHSALSLGGLSKSFSQKIMPDDVKFMLASYKRYAV